MVAKSLLLGVALVAAWSIGIADSAVGMSTEELPGALVPGGAVLQPCLPLLFCYPVCVPFTNICV